MKPKLNNKNIIKTAKDICEKYKICDNCFGRLFKEIEYGKPNEQIGKELRKKINISNKIHPKDCWLCFGLLEEINKFAVISLKSLKNYDFDTFLVGTIIDEEILFKEKTLIENFKLKFFESIKNELNREIGIILENKLSKKVDFNNPNIMIIIDTQFNTIYLQIKSLYIYGRYKKLKRGIPQTKWFCRICRGIGCKSCNYSGKMYTNSIEELIAKPTLKMTKGEDESFHGAGREDIDVKMLGNGRPFILEIKNPKKREIDLNELNEMINKKNIKKIKVMNLRFSDKNEIKIIKSKNFKKIYRVEISGDKNFDIEKLKKAALSLQGKIISQYTPTRVARRRANIYRDRKIYKISIESIEKKEATLKIESQSGTYIKELITGDDGKTKPSISGLNGFPCYVKKLDVMRIKE